MSKIKQKTTKFTWNKYLMYLKSEKWHKKRFAKGFQVGFICEKCGKYSKDAFEIHHKTYIRVLKEPLTDLMFLCPTCHSLIEVEKRRKRKAKSVH